MVEAARGLGQWKGRDREGINPSSLIPCRIKANTSYPLGSVALII